MIRTSNAQENAATGRSDLYKLVIADDERRIRQGLKNIVDWNRLGFSRRKLEDLALKSGYFYEAHRAAIDCLTLAWLLHIHPDAMADLLEQAGQKTVVVHAFGAPFEARDTLKTRGYRWHDGTSGANRHWWKEIPESALADEKNFLDELYPNGSDRAGFEIRTAADRFRRR